MLFTRQVLQNVTHEFENALMTLHTMLAEKPVGKTFLQYANVAREDQ